MKKKVTVTDFFKIEHNDCLNSPAAEFSKLDRSDTDESDLFVFMDILFKNGMIRAG